MSLAWPHFRHCRAPSRQSRRVQHRRQCSKQRDTRGKRGYDDVVQLRLELGGDGVVEDDDSVDEVFDQVSLLGEAEFLPAFSDSLETLVSAAAAVGFSVHERRLGL